MRLGSDPSVVVHRMEARMAPLEQSGSGEGSYDFEVLIRPLKRVNATRERAMAAGCQAYVTKPVDTRAFREAVLQALS